MVVFPDVLENLTEEVGVQLTRDGSEDLDDSLEFLENLFNWVSRRPDPNDFQ